MIFTLSLHNLLEESDTYTSSFLLLVLVSCCYKLLLYIKHNAHYVLWRDIMCAITLHHTGFSLYLNFTISSRQCMYVLQNQLIFPNVWNKQFGTNVPSNICIFYKLNGKMMALIYIKPSVMGLCNRFYINYRFSQYSMVCVKLSTTE